MRPHNKALHRLAMKRQQVQLGRDDGLNHILKKAKLKIVTDKIKY
jgi:hypothetical protein